MSAIPRKPPCVRCNRTHHTPQAFLLECCRCRRAWHHSCHLPPLSEDQVLALVEGDGSRQFGEGLSSWQCRRCSKKPREAGHINTRPSASKLQLDIPSGTTSRGEPNRTNTEPL
ncbi:hypothetical protein OBBRIDRAFT_721802 [Obba rivulosa]|uniref:PHD-type domain-containing protein n=1 Tax=Obba rivulosa TaxID=1052685 RepID=A0A8E2DSC5_9APHY|nr:hypothetical protein OBBRIDRAFT_721802 [Obba rivulosa]